MDTGGITKFLARTKTIAELKTLSAQCHAAVLAGEDTIAITSQGFEGGNASGTLIVSALDVGRVCEEIIEQQEGSSFSRNAFVVADMTYQRGGQ
jgi:hypothetical protein